MIKLPQRQEELVKSWNVRHCIEIDFQNGLKVYPDIEDESHIKLQSDISIEYGVSQSNDYDVGNTIIKTIKFTLSTLGRDYQSYSWNNITCDVYYLIQEYDAQEFEKIYIGKYIVLADVYKRTETIEITAYDFIYKQSLIDAQSWFTKNIIFPIKVGDLYIKLAESIEVQIDEDNYNNLINKDYMILEATQLGGKTLRDVLGWIAAICCGNACMLISYNVDTYQEKLNIVGLNDINNTIQDKQEGLVGELSKSDYSTQGYQRLNITIDAYNTTVQKQTGAEGSQYNINGNGIFHFQNSDTQNIADNILNKLQQVKYVPYTLPLNMPYFLIYQPGDVVQIDFFGETIKSPISYISCDGIITCNNNNFSFKGSEYKVGDNQQQQNIQNAVTQGITDIPNAIINTVDDVNNRIETKWIYGNEDQNIDIIAYFDDNMFTKKLFINGEEIDVTNTTGTVN